MIIAMRMRITPINIIHTHPSIPPSPLPLPDIHCDEDDTDEDGDNEEEGDEEREVDEETD